MTRHKQRGKAMAEYNKQKFYWIKLTDKFLTSETVDFLLSQKDGANYVVLYQMLCLKSVNTNGVLARQIGEILVPFDADKIQRDCKHFSIDTVRIALTLYKQLGLVYEQDNGTLKIADFERLIGSQTESAEKKMLQRAKNQANALGGQIGGQKVDICPPEIKRLDIREKEKISIKKEKLALFTPPTIEEVTAYCKERGNKVDAEQFIAFYTSKGWMVGKNKMKDWKACIRTWERRDAKPTEIRYAQRNYTEEELAEIFKDKENFDNLEI